MGTQNDADDNITISASNGIGQIYLQTSTTNIGNLAVTGAVTATGNITAYYSDNILKTYISDIKDPLEIKDKSKGFYYKANGYREIIWIR